MLTGKSRSQIDATWAAFWSGGISNPLEVIEQITNLLFIKCLDATYTSKQSKSNRQRHTSGSRVFPKGKDSKGRSRADFRWSHFKDLPPKDMYAFVAKRICPFLRKLGEDDSTYKHLMKDVQFTIPTPALLVKVVALLDQLVTQDRDAMGDAYEYMLNKIATAGQNSQFRTPRHIIELAVAMTAPKPADIICDPACGTAGFLVGAGEYLLEQHAKTVNKPKFNRHFSRYAFHGFDFDTHMLRIASMNMLLHGIRDPDIRYRNSLSQDCGAEEGKYTLVLCNPPFAGLLADDDSMKPLQQLIKTNRIDLLFLFQILRLLKRGGRAAVIVPMSVLFGTSKAHKDMRKHLIETQKLEGVIALPAGVFRPYTGIATAIVLFTKTDSGGTDYVWFYNITADGWSLNDRRHALLPPTTLGALSKTALTSDDHTKNNLPDVLKRWHKRITAERSRSRTAQSFCVPKGDIVARDYDLSFNQYQSVLPAKIKHRSPRKILTDLAKLEAQIQQGMKKLKKVLK